MTCRQCRRLMHTDFSDRSSNDRLSEHIQQCESCRTIWTAMQMIDGASSLRATPPAGLSERVFYSVLSASDVQNEHQIRRFSVGRISRFVKLSAAAVFLVVFSVLITLRAVDTGMENQTVIVHLILEAPQAQKVAVVGDWNSWQPDVHTMRNTKNGIWEIKIEIVPDKEYQYQFLVDGTNWIPDPGAALQVADGFGGVNSIMNL